MMSVLPGCRGRTRNLPINTTRREAFVFHAQLCFVKLDGPRKVFDSENDVVDRLYREAAHWVAIEESGEG